MAKAVRRRRARPPKSTFGRPSPKKPLIAAPPGEESDGARVRIRRHSLSRFTPSTFKVHACDRHDDDLPPNAASGPQHYHYKKTKDLSAERVPLRGEGDDERFTPFIHQLDRHEDGDDVALDQEPSTRIRRESHSAPDSKKRNHRYFSASFLARQRLRGDGQHDRAHDGNQDQYRRDFKRQQKVVEKKRAILLGSPTMRRCSPSAL